MIRQSIPFLEEKSPINVRLLEATRFTENVNFFKGHCHRLSVL